MIKLRKAIRKKRGSTAVFLAVILPAVISLSLMLVYGAGKMSAASRSDSLLNLAGDSVMSEYDAYIQKEYGLFLLNIPDNELSSKLRDYISFSVNSMGDMKLDSCSISSSRYAIADCGIVKKQIIGFMKDPVGIALAEKENMSEQIDNTMPLHNLRHGPTKTSLPSASVPDRSLYDAAMSLGETLSDPEVALKEGSESYMIGTYILSLFNSERTLRDSSHFFRNEVEYILSGKYSDKENLSSVEHALEGLRAGPNLAHIYADPKKLSAVTAAAEVITPGPAGAITTLGLAAAWAAAESYNDVLLLKEGYKVPVVKDSLTWATDIESIISSIESGIENEKILIKPEANRGLSYDEYLRILLTVKDENITVSRILDLIQINMRKNHDADFLISDCSAGISVNAVINGRRFSYDKKY